jgi:cyclic beta-1,2-glucan synthetase
LDPIAVGVRRAVQPVQRPRVGVERSTRVLSNGAYTVVLRGDGSGVSFTDALSLTPWPADPLGERGGLRLFVRDAASGRYERLGDGPTTTGDWAAGVATLGGVALDDVGFELEVAVVEGGVGEVRRLWLANRGGRTRRIEVTTYLEVVLATPAAYAAHPGFSKLFVQTAHDAATGALVAHRRPRAADETTPWAFHALVGDPGTEFETDRTRFIGRGASRAAPSALRAGTPLTATAGNVLDPILSLRRTVEVPSGARVAVACVLGLAGDRDAAVAAARSLRSDADVDAVLAAARRAAAARLAGMPPAAAAQGEALAGAMLDAHPALRARPEVLERAAGAATPSPAAPGAMLALLHAETAAGAAALAEFLAVARTWRQQALPIAALVLVDGRAPAYAGAEDDIGFLDVRALGAAAVDALDATAHWVATSAMPDVVVESHAVPERDGAAAAAPPGPPANLDDLVLANGTGGFAPDGREYVVRFRCGAGGLEGLPPQPWTNVIANERFGCIVSETGATFTWSGNSREHRLTPWSNDALLDPHGEALYVRDDDDGSFWSPLPGPAPAAGTAFEVRHGLGATVFRSVSHGVEAEVTVFVPTADPLRVVRLRLVDRSGRARRLSVFAYAHWVLGTTPDTSGRLVRTAIAPDGRTITARNRFAAGFADAVAFATVVAPAARAVRVGADRRAFLGASGSMARPAAVGGRARLEPHAGAGLDACAVHAVEIPLAAGAGADVAFLLGEAASATAAQDLLDRYTEIGTIDAALAASRAHWLGGVAGIQIETPSRALDLMTNAWLPYQTLACRIWGRSAFYQSGGAFGFRDQLQDAVALAILWPEIARTQILLHAARQFPEGDVLHWWHEPGARGIRTRFADDLAWLPYLAATYVAATGDTAILDEPVPFVDAAPLAPGEDELLVAATPTAAQATLYEHCGRALDRALTRGDHGLPLFGTGDWNDGMNRVGREGRGESVWMGFFLESVLAGFTPICERWGDTARLRRFTGYRTELARALEAAGWDGEWYRRGYYDDGTPLGSRSSDECRIDALVQAWAVLSGAAPADRARAAMTAVERHLVSERDGLIRLLAPPFVDTPHDPGYIKGYVAGVRENGGQYTHAALWVVGALAELGCNDRVAPLLEMLSPVHHTRTAADVARYRVEPYVVAADVYGAPPHVGRGGWTWYTGSSGWMYRVVLESLLGLRIANGDTLVLSPCVPDEWPGFRIRYRLPGEATTYAIEARNAHACGLGVESATMDGLPVPVDRGTARVALARDGREHRVEIVLGGRARRAGGGT